MPCSHKIVLTVNAFSIGIVVPVLTLIFCKHGASIDTLWAVMGCYSFAVIILEMPSGIIADLIGRKKVFVFSHVLSLISLLFLINSDGLSTVLIAVMFLGAGRAFSSGSIEALEIDDFMKQKGAEKLSSINNTLTTIECIGNFCGAIVGGYLGYIDNTYFILLVLLMIIESFLIFSSIIVFQEDIIRKKFLVFELIRNIKRMILEIKRTKSLKIILCMSFILGISLSTIETYWQSTIIQYLPEKLNWILGLISCGTYIGVGLGSFVGKFLLNFASNKQCTSKNMYYLSRVLLSISLTLVFFTGHWFFFVFVYFIIYTILGVGNLIESTIFHSSVTSTYRASVLSVLSLVTKGGGLVASIVGMIVVTYTEMNIIWLISPLVSLSLIVRIIFLLK